MMSKVGVLRSVLWAAMLALVLGGCGGSSRVPVQAPAAEYSPGAAVQPSQPSSAPMEEPAAPESAAPNYDSPPALGGAQSAPSTPRSSAGVARGRATATADALEPAPPRDRPGLGTAWGESIDSRITTAPFSRDTVQPFAVSTLWYNDREGANAMTRFGDYRRAEYGASAALGGGLTVTLQGENGRPLEGFFANGKHYVIGQPGERYTIVIRNQTRYRFECVASVDGLDVIDGLPASFDKRGYLIQPYGTLEIEGFRRSADQVAAFRFSSVRGSYSVRSGQGDRNVGVVGVAFFNEAGTSPVWSQDEVNRRHNADPFPGRYAEPPRY